MLFDYSSWFESKKLVLNQNVDCDLVLYRGWMMKPEWYCEFEKAIKEFRILSNC